MTEEKESKMAKHKTGVRGSMLMPVDVQIKNFLSSTVVGGWHEAPDLRRGREELGK